MQIRATPLPRCRAAVFWLALLLFALKALVPQGFMPGSPHGGTLIQLCSASGPIWVQGPSKADHAPDERHAAQAAACSVGAAVAAAALLGAPPAPVPVAEQVFPIAARAPPTPRVHPVLSAPLGARAPPLSLA
ncbi:DUF2946 family protein [Bordetella hinzii]|uniref:DUF2946 domain-containing protein n=3 Tax=Bordetella hinzii TaxID=103855 RepID=A0AAN1VEZ6_9BORD|nr:DUF2946 family protein [Bordetella hinzii]AKQ54115.1 hypothetical protein ACR54_00764 [Bordetella hinzii]AKQ58629.1 hypothetical protein ACR55_00722 [Bordetella hinzii]AZW16075.1 DUF2946 domain-containing protein [Bordetella hinzii]KCB26309.1 hypothetical protein L544_3490 [Bordetella hinzii OH87 BAL007II]KCB29610.1 hypothetical protein L541_0828 [Bordetella hinzii CA90 BAL1384]